MNNNISADNYFCIIPEWVLYSSISSNAVRLYGTLQRYADKDSGQCHPSRKTLADKCGLSLSSLDRALIELVELGAVRKQQRLSSKGDWTSNIYTVITHAGVSSQVNTPIVTDEETGVVTGEEQTKVNVNQSQERAQRIADEWWQAYKVRTGGKTPTGKGAWHALIAIVNGSLKAGWTEQQVTDALMQCSVPSASMLDIQLNKLIAKPTAIVAPISKRRMPIITGDSECGQCEGSGVFSVFIESEQQWQSKKCDCYKETF